VPLPRPSAASLDVAAPFGRFVEGDISPEEAHLAASAAAQLANRATPDEEVYEYEMDSADVLELPDEPAAPAEPAAPEAPRGDAKP